MDFASQTGRTLHDEHRASLALLGRAEGALTGGATGPDAAATAKDLAHHLRQEVDRHFGFEEASLFPRLAEAGEADIAELLAEEHDSIRAVADELLPMLQAVAEGRPGDARVLTRSVVELIERQVAHIQKESMALLPLLDDLLDEETDRALAFEYASR